MLILVVLLIMVSALVTRLSGGNFSNQGSQADHLASLAAQSGVNRLLDFLEHRPPTDPAELAGSAPDESWHYRIRLNDPNCFVPNLQSQNPVAGPHGATSVPAKSAFAVVEGWSQLRSCRVEVIIGYKPLFNSYGNGVVVSGKLAARGNLQMKGVKNYLDQHEIPADVLSLVNDVHQTDVITWQKGAPGDRADISGKVKVVSSNPAAFGPQLRGDPAVTGFRAEKGLVNNAPSSKPGNLNLDSYIEGAAQSHYPAPPLSGSATTLPPGNYYVNGDFVYDGDLTMDKANVFVSGRTEINGSLNGKGTLLSGSTTSIYGTAKMKTSNQAALAIYSKGDITLQGLDGLSWLKDRAHQRGNDSNSVPYEQHVSDLIDSISQQKADLEAHLRGDDPDSAKFGKNDSESDKLAFLTAHTDPAGRTTSLPFTSDPNRNDPVGHLKAMLVNEPDGREKRFMLQRLNELHGDDDTGLYAVRNPTAGSAPDYLADALQTGNLNFLADIINDAGSYNSTWGMANPHWADLSADQQGKLFSLLQNTLDNLSYGRVGTARFVGTLFTHGAIISDSKFDIAGSVIAYDNGSWHTAAGSPQPGDIAFRNDTSIKYVLDFEAAATETLGHLGVLSWTTP